MGNLLPEDAGGRDARLLSEEWIATFAAELDQTYNRLMSAADLWVLGYILNNSETYKAVDNGEWPIFWTHYEIVRGTKVEDHEATVFTCSC